MSKVISCHGIVGGSGATTVGLTVALSLAEHDKVTYTSLKTDDLHDAMSHMGATSLPDDGVMIEGVWFVPRRYKHFNWDTGVIVEDGYNYLANFKIGTITNSYLALRKVVQGAAKYDAIVCLFDSQRPLTKSDVANVIGSETQVVFVDRDPAVARAHDAGLFGSRRPGSLRDVADLVISEPFVVGTYKE